MKITFTWIDCKCSAFGMWVGYMSWIDQASYPWLAFCYALDHQSEKFATESEARAAVEVAVTEAMTPGLRVMMKPGLEAMRFCLNTLVQGPDYTFPEDIEMRSKLTAAIEGLADEIACPSCHDKDGFAKMTNLIGRCPKCNGTGQVRAIAKEAGT